MLQGSIHDENVKVLNFLRASSLAQCPIISPIKESELERARIIQRRIAHTYTRPPHSLSLERHRRRRRRRRHPFPPDFSSVLRCRERAHSVDDPREIHTYLGGPRGGGEQVLRFASAYLRKRDTMRKTRARICGMPTCGRVWRCIENDDDDNDDDDARSPGQTYVNRLAWGEPRWLPYGCAIRTHYTLDAFRTLARTCPREQACVSPVSFAPLYVSHTMRRYHSSLCLKCRTVLYNESFTCGTTKWRRK